jgi:hypothetical protein
VACSAAALISASRAQEQPASGSLADLKGRYETAMGDTVRRYETEVGNLFSLYLKALDTLEAELQRKGDLPGVLAIKKEKGNVALSRSVPDLKEDGLYDAVAKLRDQYHQQRTSTLIAEGKAIQELIAKYRTLLESMVRKLTMLGRTDEAVEAQAESERVKDGREARMAAFILAVEGTTSGRADGGEQAAVPIAARTRTVSLLDSTVIDSFSYGRLEVLRQPVALLNRYIAAVFPNGIAVRLEAPGLNARPAVVPHGAVPQYEAVPTRVEPQPWAAGGFFQLTKVTASDLLKMICAGCRLGYRIDGEGGEVVIVEDSSPDAEWTALTVPPERLAAEMQTLDGRNKHAGRTVVVTGELRDATRGAADLFLTLDNKVRLRFPKSGEGSVAGADLEAMLEQAKTANRERPETERFVEVTAMGEVSKKAVPGLVLLDRVVVMERRSDARHPGFGRGRMRVFEGPNRRARRIGE